MKTAGILTCLALALPKVALAQGAVLETLEELKQVSAPASFRGVLPAHVDLSPKLPPVRGQGATSTCVSWSATYAAASFALRGHGFDAGLRLSPAFTYDQVARDPWCRIGTTISAVLNLLRDRGALPIEEFAFDAGWCGRMPTAGELNRAKQYRIKAWSAFDAAEVDRVKEQLARGVPVIFGTFTTAKLGALRGDDVLQDDDVPGEGHAMLAVGYDDGRRAFLIQNSFGTGWGSNGYGWFGYEWWKRNVRVGYVIE